MKHVHQVESRWPFLSWKPASKFFKHNSTATIEIGAVASRSSNFKQHRIVKHPVEMG